MVRSRVLQLQKWRKANFLQSWEVKHNFRCFWGSIPPCSSYGNLGIRLPVLYHKPHNKTSVSQPDQVLQNPSPQQQLSILWFPLTSTHLWSAYLSGGIMWWDPEDKPEKDPSLNTLILAQKRHSIQLNTPESKIIELHSILNEKSKRFLVS